MLKDSLRSHSVTYIRNGARQRRHYNKALTGSATWGGLLNCAISDDFGDL